ncbi:MAG: prepilin peptidase [Clostridia bacterium]|nr:prepilin peptidase [Clostridia bacterium]
MQPFSYLNTPAGLMWVIVCIPLGVLMTALAYWIINHVPAKWLCDYNETPSEELLTGKRVKFLPTGAVASVIAALCLVLCRLQFNKGYDIYFCLLAVIVFDCLLIAVADIKYQIIPDQFTIALGVLALAVTIYDFARGYHIFHTQWWSPIAGAFIGGAVMLLVDFIGMLLYKRDGMGFGDVKLFFAAGILTGFPGTIYTFLISILAAAVCFVVIILISKLTAGSSENQEENTGLPEEKQDGEESSLKESTTDGSEKSDLLADEAAAEEQTEEKSVGLGSYLAFGPYIAAAVIAYIAFFDSIYYLVGLYLNLF